MQVQPWSYAGQSVAMGHSLTLSGPQYHYLWNGASASWVYRGTAWINPWKPLAEDF